MTTMTSTATQAQRPQLSPPNGNVLAMSFWALLAALAVFLLFVAVKKPATFERHDRPISDFDAHYLAGKQALTGNLAPVYSAETFGPLQRQVTSDPRVMPWAYPPPAHLPLMLLPALPLPYAYLAFVGLGFLAFAAVLARVARGYVRYAAVAAFPAVQMNVLCGQNGMLTGALIGLACLYMLKRDDRSGYPLGLMVMKPHLGLAFGLSALMQRQWGLLARAAAVAVIASAVATVAFGPAIWGAFLNAINETSAFLKADTKFPLFRMVSAFAFVRSSGASFEVALAAQAVSAAAACALLAYAVYRNWSTRAVVGLSALLAPFISPYAYDYDMTISAIGFAILLPLMVRGGRRVEAVAATLLLFAATAYPITQYVAETDKTSPLSLGWLFAAAAIAVIVRALAMSARPVHRAPV